MRRPDACILWLCIVSSVLCGQQLDVQRLDQIRLKTRVPAIAVYLKRGETDVFLAASGVRSRDAAVAVTVDDLWHIGSDTKAMTATLIARLVEQGKLRFDSSVGEIFADDLKRFHPGAAKITVEQLLSHRSGLPRNPPLRRLDAMYKSKEPIIEQRLALTREVLAKQPAKPPGTHYDYSNLGYIILGSICERITGKPWEEALAEQVLTPLGITHLGFGAPGSPSILDQPRGHQSRLFGSYHSVEPGLEADNPQVFGPAGRVHISLVDWMRFAEDQLRGETGGGKLLTSGTYQRLHTPVGDGVYALGWGVITLTGGIKSIQHAGSNGAWLALVALLPSCNAVMIFTANDGTGRGEDAISLARAAALDRATGLCPDRK